jgi:DNA-binding winged helix-turn-helix (wHTH) protein
MDCAVSESLAKLLLRRSEGGPGAVIWGREAQPHFGRMFDRLLADGLLKERAPATTWAPCSICEGHCGERDIVVIGDRLVAECPEDHRRDSVLSTDLIRSFEIDTEALACLIAEATGLQGSPFQASAGAWILGRTSLSGRAVALILDPVVGRNPDLVTLLRAGASTGCAMTVLLPSGLSRAETQPLNTAGFHIVAAVDALADATGGGFVLDMAVLDPVVQREPQVILRAGSRSIVIFGRTVKLSDRRFQVAEALAEAASRGAIASRRSIERKLYGTQSVDDKLVADAIRDLRSAIAPILPSGMSPVDFIQTRPGLGYALVIERELIRLDP